MITFASVYLAIAIGFFMVMTLSVYPYLIAWDAVRDGRNK